LFAQLKRTFIALNADKRLRIRPPRGERRERVRDRRHPAGEAHLVPLQPARIAAAVDALVVLGDRFAHARIDLGRLVEDLQSVFDVLAHFAHFRLGQRTVAFDQCIVDARHADIEKQARHAEILELVAGENPDADRT
jgi:hypothetical protein